MIFRPKWPQAAHDEFESPFQRGARERPLRLTFHNESFADLTQQERQALDLIRSLAHRPILDLVETDPSAPQRLRVHPVDEANDQVPVTVCFADGSTLSTAVCFAHQWPGLAAHIIGQPQIEPLHPDTVKALPDLYTAYGHHEAGLDVFVTASRTLLTHRVSAWVAETNPYSVLEATRLVGLFMRSRDDYSLSVEKRSRYGINPGGYYFVLARHRLPAMWRYFGACVHSEKVRGDDILMLGQSILVRAVRALEARDAIGQYFYVRQNNDTADRMMYHFDYLLVVLAGAIDAQMRVAHRAYDLPGRERDASVRRPDFKQHLLSAGGAALHAVLTAPNFADFVTLLYEPRNRIHGAAFHTLLAAAAGKPGETYVPVPTFPEDLASAMWDAASRLSSPSEWGLLRRNNEVWLEPYTFASTMVTEALRRIDAVAAGTEVGRLFGSSPVPQLSSDPPEGDGIFDKAVREVVSLLG